jgi:hypothetical protein
VPLRAKKNPEEDEDFSRTGKKTPHFVVNRGAGTLGKRTGTGKVGKVDSNIVMGAALDYFDFFVFYF